MSAETIRCKECGRVNDVTAFACEGCGASLVGGGAERWVEARARDLVLESEADAARARRAFVRRIATGVVVAGVLAVGVWQGSAWYSRNYYLLAAPTYDDLPPEHWANVMLTDEDRYMRRRAALALDSIAPRFNERTAREIVPSLKQALDDPDDVVRLRARSALARIEAATGVTE